MAAAECLRAEVDELTPKQAEPGNERPGREEAQARLRLAMVALALDDPAEASRVLERLAAPEPEGGGGGGGGGGKFELQRLALGGLAAWSLGSDEDKNRAAENFDGLHKLSTDDTVLALRSLVLVRSVVSYGRYQRRATNICRPGQSAMAYCEVLNFDCRRLSDESYRSSLEVDLALEKRTRDIDRRGRPREDYRTVQKFPDFAKVQHATHSPLGDLHLVINFPVPRDLPADGEYYLAVTVRDPDSGETSEPIRVALEVRSGL